MPTATRQDIKKNIDRAIDLIKLKFSEGTCLIVLPELSSISYDRETFDKLEILSEELYGPAFNRYSLLAKELSSFIAYGIPRKENKKYFISQIVIDPEGKYLGHYDKLHLAQFGDSIEKDYFSAGSKFCVFGIDEIKFGIILCYDIRFPLLSRILRKKYSVDVILHPCAFSKDNTFFSWHSFAVTRALENHCYFISVNRAGERWGSSILCPPWVDGTVVPEILDDKERFYEVDINKNLIESKRKEFPFFDDENPVIDS